MAGSARADAPSATVGQAYPPGPCDASDVLALIGKDGALQKRKHAAAVIQMRVAECKEIITKYLASLPAPRPPAPPFVTAVPGLPSPPTPAPVPTIPAACEALSTDDVVRAYSVLNFCSKWIAKNVAPPAPGPASSATPPPLMFHGPVAGSSAPWNKIVYVFALASDAPTSAQIALQLASELKSRQLERGPVPDLYAPNVAVKYKIVAQPAWTLALYQQQCFMDPSTAGAIVALQPSVQSASYNALFSASWTKVGLEAIVINCEPTNTAYVNNAAFITWVSDVHTQTGRRYSFALSSALAVLSAIVTLHPPRTTNYTTVPPSPLPAPGTSYQTGYSTGLNQGAGLTAAAGVAALTPLASTNIGQGPGPDAQTAAAITKDVKVLIPDLLSPCTDRSSAQPSNLSATQCQWFDPK
jgi:hypothetical protein